MNEDRRGTVNKGKNVSVNDDKITGFAKIKRIAAMVGVIILAGFYIVALVAAVGNWENSHAIFMTALYLSIAVPVIIYVMMLIHRHLSGKDDGTGEKK